MSTPNKWSVRDVAKASFFSLKTGKLITYLDTLKTSGVETKSTTVYARGGSNNVKILGFNGDKESKITLQDALFDNRVMAFLTGNNIVKGEKNIYQREILIADTNIITLKSTPVGDPIGVYVLGNDGIEGVEYTKGTPATNPTDYSIASKVITLNSAVTDGTKFAVYYKTSSGTSANTIKVTTDAFGGACKLVLDVLVQDSFTKALYPAQIEVFNCQVEDNWKFDFKPDGEPAVLDIPLEVLKNPTSEDMWQMTIYDTEELQ